MSARARRAIASRRRESARLGPSLPSSLRPSAPSSLRQSIRPSVPPLSSSLPPSLPPSLPYQHLPSSPTPDGPYTTSLRSPPTGAPPPASIPPPPRRSPIRTHPPIPRLPSASICLPPPHCPPSLRPSRARFSFPAVYIRIHMPAHACVCLRCVRSRWCWSRWGTWSAAWRRSWRTRTPPWWALAAAAQCTGALQGGLRGFAEALQRLCRVLQRIRRGLTGALQGLYRDFTEASQWLDGGFSEDLKGALHGLYRGFTAALQGLCRGLTEGGWWSPRVQWGILPAQSVA